MPATQNPRHVAFARFVKRAVDHAADGRGWRIPDVATASGVGRSTIYRWLKADMTEDPRGGDVEAFCDTLDIPPSTAFAILWPGKGRRRTATEPLPGPLDPDVEVLLRRLRDPNVIEVEKYLIRETFKSLAARSTRAARAQPEKPTRQRRTG